MSVPVTEAAAKSKARRGHISRESNNRLQNWPGDPVTLTKLARNVTSVAANVEAGFAGQSWLWDQAL